MIRNAFLLEFSIDVSCLLELLQVERLIKVTDDSLQLFHLLLGGSHDVNLSLNKILTLRSDRSKDLGWSGSLLDLLFLLVSFLLLFLSLLVESLLVLLRDRLWFGSTLLNNDWRFMSSWLVGLSLVEVVDNLHPSVVLSLLFGIDDSLFSVSYLLLLLFSVLKLLVHCLEVDEGHGVLRWLSDNLLLESVSFSSGVFTIIDDSGELIGVEKTLIIV